MNSVAKIVPAFASAFAASDRDGVVTALFEKSPTAIAVTDETASVLWINQAGARLLGVDRNDFIAKSTALFDAARLGGESWAGLVEAMNKGRPWHGQMKGTRPSGTAFLCAV